MIAEALKVLIELGQQAADVKAIPLGPADPRRSRFFSSRGQTFEIDNSPPARCHVVETLDAFARAVERWAPSGAMVFHNRDKIELVIDDATRWDRVTLPLVPHPLWTLVQKLGPPLGHKEFAKMLRQDLADCQIDPAFVLQIRKVTASYGGSATSETRLGADKGMRQYDSSLSEELPDIISAAVPVYTVPDLPSAPRVFFGFDVAVPPAPLTFSLRLLPGQVDAAYLAVQAELASRLADVLPEDATILWGAV
jgi:hypothetical protein